MKAEKKSVSLQSTTTAVESASTATAVEKSDSTTTANESPSVASVMRVSPKSTMAIIMSPTGDPLDELVTAKDFSSPVVTALSSRSPREQKTEPPAVLRRANSTDAMRTDPSREGTNPVRKGVGEGQAASALQKPLNGPQRSGEHEAVVCAPTQVTLEPTCTGTSVMAIAYNRGVVVMTDRVVSYGKSARYKNVSRQYKVNDSCIVAFGGDHADFQWLQNVIERKVLEWNSHGQEMGPRALHGYLTSLLYARRCKSNPLWNTLIVAGIEDEEKNNKETSRPFIGVVTMRGVAYETKHVATGIGAMLLNQIVEDEWRKKGADLTRAEATAVLRKGLELTLYHDCCADNDFEIGTIDIEEGVSLGKQETIIGDWSIAETNCQYE